MARGRGLAARVAPARVSPRAGLHPAAGEVATHVVTEEQTTEVADAPPNSAVVEPGTKPVPVIVTAVPPATGPLAGVIPERERALVVVADGPPLLDTVCPVKTWFVLVPAESVTVKVA